MIPDRDRPSSISFSDHDFHVTLANGRTLAIPLINYPTLAHATPAQRANVQLSLGGIYWPELNLDISLLELLSGTTSPARSPKPRYCEG